MKKKTGLLGAFWIFVAAIIVLSLSYFRIFENFELATFDLRFSLRPPQIQNRDIAIIEISNDTLEKIGRWPFKRSWHAAIIDILSACGAKSIIFDTLFCEPSEDDAALIESTRNAGNVYYSFSFDMPKRAKGLCWPGYGGRESGIVKVERIDSFILPGLIENARGYGFINVIPDKDGKTRRVPLRIKYNGKVYPHLALLVAADYLGKDIDEIKAPLGEESCMLINYAGKWHDTFKHYSFVDILKSYSMMTKGEEGTVDLGGLMNKVCFIGLTATGTHDLNPVPLEERYPGLGIHINTFNTLCTQNFLTRADRLANLLILVIFGFLTALVTLRTRPLVSSLSIVSLIILLCAFAMLLFAFLNIWIDLFYPIIALFAVYLTIVFYKYVTERQKMQLIERELEVAKKIQQSFLPEGAPDIEGIDLTAEMSPAKQVGGDLYDFVKLEDGKIGIMVGDVSGKGVPAALYMARTVSLFRIFSKAAPSPKEVVTKLNDALEGESKTNLFVTLSYHVYDPKSHTLLFSSGGHLPTILLKDGEKDSRLLEAKAGLPLGLMTCEFDEEKLPLSNGDILILYTDGVTEAISRTGEEFGKERLIKVAEENRHLDSKGMLAALNAAVFKFSEHMPQHDDITIIVTKVR